MKKYNGYKIQYTVTIPTDCKTIELTKKEIKEIENYKIFRTMEDFKHSFKIIK